MNEILILGHAASGLKDVENQLYRCGMQAAKPSKREGLLPIDITAMICKAHDAPSVSGIESEQDFQQLTVGAVWHGLALDLLLGNLGQKLWGWADSSGIFLLDYWKELEPRMTFILVYDDPRTALSECEIGGQVSEDEVERRLNNWVAYNGAMLRFFLRNRSRCLLVHAQQVRRTTQKYLDQLQARLGIVLSEAASVSDLSVCPQINNEEAVKHELLTLSDGIVRTLGVLNIAEADISRMGRSSVADEYIAEQLVMAYPRCGKLYEELQAAANLPLDGALSSKSGALAAWIGKAAERRAYFTGLSTICSEYEAIRTELLECQSNLAAMRDNATATAQRAVHLEEALGQSQLELDRKQAMFEASANEVAKLRAEATRITTERRAADPLGEEKTKLLIAQLHQLQREMDEQRSLSRAASSGVTAKTRPKPGAVDRIKQDLPYRLGQIIVKRGATLALPWLLSKESKLFWEKQSSRDSWKPISEYSDAHEVEKVKKHLSYRLGLIVVEQGSHPLAWLKLPFALIREAGKFKRERKEKERGVL